MYTLCKKLLNHHGEDFREFKSEKDAEKYYREDLKHIEHMHSYRFIVRLSDRKIMKEL